MMQLLGTIPQQLVNGVTLGAIYAIVALGYSLVYGVLRLFNFAHGDLFMLGAYFGITLLSFARGTSSWAVGAGVLLVLGYLVATLGAGLAGMAVEKFSYRPVAKATRLAQLISVLGASLVIENAVMLVWGKRNIYFPSVVPQHVYTLGGVSVTNIQLYIVGLTFVLLAGLYYFINKTTTGLALRATSENPVAASLMGIDIRSSIALTFFLGPALGGAAGLMYSQYYGIGTYIMGWLVGIKGFVATVIGGIGSIAGAVVGGFLLGLAENVGAGFLPVLTGGAFGPEYRDIFAFTVLILVLIIRPSGIMGERG